MLVYGQLQEGLSYSLIESPVLKATDSSVLLLIRRNGIEKEAAILKTEKPPPGGQNKGSFQRNYNSKH